MGSPFSFFYLFTIIIFDLTSIPVGYDFIRRELACILTGFLLQLGFLGFHVANCSFSSLSGSSTFEMRLDV